MKLKITQEAAAVVKFLEDYRGGLGNKKALTIQSRKLVYVSSLPHSSSESNRNALGC